MTESAGAATDTVPGAASPCRVYGIVRAGVNLPDWDDDDVVARHLRIVGHHQVAAVVEDLDPAQRAGRRDLLAHSLVLNGVAAAGEPVIPVRFGSVVPSEQDVIDDLLAPHEQQWRQLLDSVRGCSQFTLRAGYDQERVLREIVLENPEVAELRERTLGRSDDAGYADRVRLGELVASAVERKRSDDVEMLVGSLLAYCREHRASQGSELDRVGDIAFLVDDERRDAFERAAEDLAERVHERITLRLLGPLAQFDFVTEDRPWA